MKGGIGKPNPLSYVHIIIKNNMHLEIKQCQCYLCGKKSKRKYNFTLNKWARKFKCVCGSQSFRWYNY